MIHLILTDDWEIRGDGSGNMDALQFRTLQRLLEIYERHGLVASLNAEVMQQLNHRSLGRTFPELLELSLAWEDAVKDAYRRGHDIQLHLHPQWSDCSYNDGEWSLAGSWQITDYPPSSIDAMIAEGKRYLEELLRPLDPGYRCVAYRSGAWCAVPSTPLFEALGRNGIVVDLSIVDGLRVEGPKVWLDYSAVEEPFLPYYPDPADARKVAATRQPVVCVPTHSFRAEEPILARRGEPRRPLPRLRYRVSRRAAQVGRRFRLPFTRSLIEQYLRTPNDVPPPNAGHRADYARGLWSPVPLRTVVSDLSVMSTARTREAFRDIRIRAERLNVDHVPIVFTNHIKDIGNFTPLERFGDLVAGSADIDVITLRSMVANLEAGMYAIRSS